MSDLKRKAALREVSIEAISVNDGDELDALFNSGMLEDKAIAKITNILLNDLDNDDLDNDDLDNIDAFAVDAFADDWLADEPDNTEISKEPELPELDDERDRLQKELKALRSQHEFECEYVDQLEQEIISITNDRDRQVSELTAQLAAKPDAKSEDLQAHPLAADDRDLSDRLAIHVLQLEEEFQHRLAIALEIESQKIAQQYIQEINEKTELINQLQAQHTSFDISQQTLTEKLLTAQDSLTQSTIALEITQAKLLESTKQRDQIEEELIQHLSNQAQLHQSLRGLENEYVSDLTRVQDSEQQIEELQEQVLRQAAKAAEYEAAIQHWKEQSVRHQHHALQLSGALDRLLDEKPVRHLTQPISINSSSESAPECLLERSPQPAAKSMSESRESRSPRPSVDLPSFLVRHR